MRNQQLDILRAVAILLVLGRHSHYSVYWNRCGWMGVDLFFVLSGYLIAGLLFTEFKRHGRISVLNFYARRGFKIYPLFYCFILLTILLGARTWPIFPLKSVLAELFFFQNYVPGLWAHTWSLAVEEHFYLALPWMLVICAKLSRRTDNPFGAIPAIVALSSVLALLLRLARAEAGQETFYSYLAPTHLRFDTLALGVLLSYLAHFRPTMLARLSRLPLWLFGLVLIVPPFFLPIESRLMHTVGLATTSLGCGCFLLAALNTRLPGSGISASLLRKLAQAGFYSYSIYLWHLPVAMAFADMSSGVGLAFTPFTTAIRHWTYVALSIGIGILLSHSIELPMLRVRDRLFPSRSSRTAAVRAVATST